VTGGRCAFVSGLSSRQDRSRIVVQAYPSERRADLVGEFGDSALDLERALRCVDDASGKVRVPKTRHSRSTSPLGGA
jgi:hypothetical protein